VGLRRLLAILGLLWLAAPSAPATDLRAAVWVDDASGRPLENLEAGDFAAELNNAAAPVESALGPGDPLVLLLVLDMVGDLNRIDVARGAIASHIENMGEQWYVALLQAQDGLLTLQDPTQNRRQLIDKLMAASVSGFPGLLDSVEQVASLGDTMLARAGVRVAVLYLTDGSISEYRGDYVNTVVNPSDRGDLSRRFRDRLIQEKIASLDSALQAYSPPLFFVHLEERQNSQDVAYQNGISQFASSTGGGYWISRSLSDVPNLVQQALGRIGSHYSLTLEAPADLTPPVQLRLTTQDPNAVVSHRAQLPLPQADGKKAKKGKKAKADGKKSKKGPS